MCGCYVLRLNNSPRVASMTDSRPPKIDFRAHGEKGQPEVIEICEELLIGEYPRVEDVAWLRKAFGVSAIHSLQDDYDLACRGLDLASLTETLSRQRRRARAHSDSRRQRSRSRAALWRDIGCARLNGWTGASGLSSLQRVPEPLRLRSRPPSCICAKNMSVDDAIAYLRKRRICFPDTLVLAEYFSARRLDL